MTTFLNDFVAGLTPTKIIALIIFLTGCLLYIIWMDAMASGDWNWKKTIAVGCILIGVLPSVYSALARADATKCPQCNQTVTSRFCPDCGWKATSNVSTCPNCDAEINMEDQP